MDLSRRAKSALPVPENRRTADLYRPVTTAAYSSPIPLVIGQARVPATIFRDGRVASNYSTSPVDGKIRYGLCEGPIVSIGKEYANQGQQVEIGTVAGQEAHPNDPLPWAGVDAAPGASTANLSFEVSTDLALDDALGAYVQATLGTDSGLTTAGQPKTVTDFHVCTTGNGATAVQYMAAWSWNTQDIRLFKRAIGGTWAVVSTVTSALVAASAKPATGSLPQPRVAAVGDLVHVVWSRLDNAAEPVEICHAWSANAGLTWTYGQSMGTVAKTAAIGAFKLSLSLHSSGEVWVCFQKRNTATAPAATVNNTMGVCVGFLPSTATAATSWIRPDLTSTGGGSGGYPITGFQGELCLVDTSSFAIPFMLSLATLSYMVRSPSIIPLGSGKALLSCIYSPAGTASQKPMFVIPIAADTMVHWDLPAAAFQLYPAGGGHNFIAHNNLADIVWISANGYASRSMGWTSSSTVGNSFGTMDLTSFAAYEKYNEGSTQLILIDSTHFAILVNYVPMAYPASYYDIFAGAPIPDGSPDGHPDRLSWGQWRLYRGALGAGSISWDSGYVEISTPASPGFAAKAFYNGSGQIFIAMGLPAMAGGGKFWETFSAPEIKLLAIPSAIGAASEVLRYSPATALQNSVSYQIYPGNGDLFALMREDEALDDTAQCGIRTVTINPGGFGDVLPSVMCKRLLTGDNHRGLAIRGLAFDTVTWDKFDQYCTAMGIRFSLALTSQEAAWPLVVNILESANAVPFRSQGLLKVFVRETATITGNGVTYAPLPEHAAPCMAIPERDLRDGISIDPVGIDAMWNRMSVGWKNRKRAYADQTTVIQDEGAVARRGVIPASSCDWHWITDEQTALTCAWLRMRHQQRTGRTYSFAVSQKYMLLEPGDIVTVGHGHIPVRPVRILEISEGDADWREVTAEDVVVATSAVAPPGAPGGSTPASVNIASPVNLPIIFVALIGGLLQVWILLSGPSGWRGCAVQQSWDGVAWESVGTCITPSPTGHLLQDMSRLRVQPGLRVHPGLLVGASDFALGDYSEGTALPPWPAWGDYLAGNPGALLWVDGELIAYAAESDNGVDQAQCSILRRGLYGTTKGPHPILSRCGAVTDAAFQWPIPAGSNGRTCYWRFPSFGEDPGAVTTYSVEIPA